jgi:hypothetical protein
LIGKTTKCLKCKSPGKIVPGKPVAVRAPKHAARARVSGIGNYPNLTRYLDWCTALAKVFLVLGLVCVGLLAITLVVIALGQPVDGLQKILGLFVAAGFSALSALIVYVGYVATMAGTEIVRVLVDIESNTRSG